MKTLRISDKDRIAIKPDGTRIPVRDAKFSFLITPNEEDISNGVKGDPANCMYSLCCRRLHGSELVWVTRMLAYVELKTKGGKSTLFRFFLKEPARENIKEFDLEGQVQPESVIFAAPRGCHTLDGQSENYRQWVEKQRAEGKSTTKPKRKAHVKGESSIHKIPFALRDKQTGMFQFKRPAVTDAIADSIVDGFDKIK